MLYFAPWKTALILLTCLLGILYAAPNVMPAGLRASLPNFVPANTVNLGLDLQGGAHLLLEVDADNLYTERLQSLSVDLRDTLSRPEDGSARIPHRRAVRESDLTVAVTIRDPAEMDRALALLRDAAPPVTSQFGAPSLAREYRVAREGDALLRVSLTPEWQEQALRAAVAQSVEVVRRRIDELGTREPTIQPQGTNRILVQVPGITDTQRLKDILGRTAKLTFHLVDPSVRFPGDPSSLADPDVRATIQTGPDTEWIPTRDGFPPFEPIISRVEISGEDLSDARGGFNPTTNEPAVFLNLNTKGARQFSEITAENVNQRFAIILDDQVLTAPVINEPIPGGSAVITGNFTVESANDLGLLLRSGSLPARLTIEEERTVGPEMGADSIKAGQTAAMIGFVAVVAFIILSYGLFGVFANIALMINLMLIMGVLSLLQATLTLPGIAGIVLTVGMAVDANVLIFERIREELRSGKSPLNAVDAGYSRALGTILDANITTLIAAVILFQFGSGPVKGFAVTLAVGIVTSVFTAFTLTRLMVVTWLKRTKPAEIPI